MKTYSGKYKPKNKRKYVGNHKDVVYRSRWELYAFRWCDEEPNVKYWSSEEIQIPYIYEMTRRKHRYFPDLFIVYNNGKKVIVEIKPYKQTLEPVRGKKRKATFIAEIKTYTKNKNKWSAAEIYAKERGIEFQVWTEIELEKLGILPKGHVTNDKRNYKAYKRRRKKSSK